MSKKLTMEELLLSAGYSAKAIKLYLNKVNVGSIENSDVALTYTGLPCGDTITLYLKLGKDGTIQDAKFKYKGCIGTASSGSALTMLVIGKTVKEAWNITKDDILKELDGLPENHCAELVINALHKALEKLENKNKLRT
jgi:NifU-like protein involved in Fe-S cluster formation